jgi:hypothetical protein
MSPSQDILHLHWHLQPHVSFHIHFCVIFNYPTSKQANNIDKKKRQQRKHPTPTKTPLPTGQTCRNAQSLSQLVG